MSNEPDDTVRLPREDVRPLTWGSPAAEPAPARPAEAAPLAAGAGLLLVLVLIAAGAWWFWPRPEPAPVRAPPPPPPIIATEPPAGAPGMPPAPPAPAIPAFPLMDRDAILAWNPAEPTLIRMADRPAVFLLGFPDLSTQARTMNRMAALIEKARAPRDRVLNDAELAAVIEADGETPDTYYYGHNYTLDDILRFYALALSGDVVLNDGERWLEARLPEIRAAGGPGPLALITLPGLEDRFDARARRAVLEHEAGHGRFFTDPPYAAFVMHVWRTVFTESERAAFRAFMVREGYDTANETLMANEAMAYFVCTPDRRFFDPRRDVGMDEENAARLRAALAGP
ncbi:hypothetical protein [Muricoccus radiodurans]|uniref:hypothetical protein n=1 Tax=Muricoccus radiodurans TaxID=2231721 RepID=UPI003CE95E49